MNIGDIINRYYSNCLTSEDKETLDSILVCKKRHTKTRRHLRQPKEVLDMEEVSILGSYKTKPFWKYGLLK